VRDTCVNSLVGFEAGSLHAQETTFRTMQPGKHLAPRFVKRAYAFLDVAPRHVSCRDVSVVWDVYVPILGNLRIVAGHVATKLNRGRRFTGRSRDTLNRYNLREIR
jgi:hypothetical protein